MARTTKRAQVPGVDNPKPFPTGTMAELLAQGDDEIRATIPGLGTDQLTELHALESEGQNRRSIVALAAEVLASRRPAEDGGLPDARDIPVPKPGHPAVLTKQGWLCPASLPSED